MVKTMKLILIVFCLLFYSAVAKGDTYNFPNGKKPAISLREAAEIAENMLKLQGHDNKFFAYYSLLYGDKEQTGDGAWNISYVGKDGINVQAFIPLLKGNPKLIYTSPETNKRKEVEFLRKGTKVKKAVKEAKNAKPKKAEQKR